MGTDFWIVLRWWGTLFLVGAVAFPLTKRLFSSWWDHGYFFAKAVGMAVVTYIVYLLAFFHIIPFSEFSIWLSMISIFVIGLVVQTRTEKPSISKKLVIVLLIEELVFFLALLFWSWVKGHEPSIHGLEKFMDFGFMKSILNSRYFPAPDMWYAGFPINYYYFGHTVVAVLTKLSGIDLVYTFNLMLATIFALCLTMSFSIGKQISTLFGAILTAFLVTLAGNMQTIYAFTKGYTGENVKPFWELLWPIGELWSKLPEGLERYWYANATRFIPFTIHEFPSYSFVVSDIHGHVLSIPFVLLAIGLLIHIFGFSVQKRVNHESGIMNYGWVHLSFYGLLVAVLLMTNALDGPIYLGLFLVLFMIHNSQFIIQWKKYWKRLLIGIGIIMGTAMAASIPFMSRFSSFVSGVALNCPPAFLANRKIGILLFEGVEKCQHSPLWMIWLLWGFFIFCGAWLFLNKKFTQIEKILLTFFFFSIALIIFPEFFYFKDIYPAHFRSNTMFKLGYQAFILFSIISGYMITKTLTKRNWKRTIFLILIIPQLFLVSIFPIFSVRSYFDSLRTYKGLDGLTWLQDQYPDDWAGIMWFNSKGIKDGAIVEADGDSYTDHARFSAFTGLPAVIGWPVHEWLWRGTYDVVAPRREEVRIIYESDDLEATKSIVSRYGVQYIIVGQLEREKFKSMIPEKFNEFGKLVFSQGSTQIYKVY